MGTIRGTALVLLKEVLCVILLYLLLMFISAECAVFVLVIIKVVQCVKMLQCIIQKRVFANTIVVMIFALMQFCFSFIFQEMLYWYNNQIASLQPVFLLILVVVPAIIRIASGGVIVAVCTWKIVDWHRHRK